MRLSILTILFAGLSALLYFTASHAAAQAPGPVGTVSQIQGPATVTRLGAPRALASGDQIYVDDCTPSAPMRQNWGGE